jgi:predicted SAM-dependent methyltransferase
LAKPGWINVDLFAEGADYSLDLREELPFADNSAALIYSSHVLEHFEYPGEVHLLLRECFRILQPGGLFTLAVPDCGRVLQAYVERDSEFFAFWRPRSYLLQDPTLMHHVNYLFRADGRHRYAWDEDTLGSVLTIAGFTDVRRRDFDPLIDSNRRSLRSLYMEGKKPLLPIGRIADAR